MCLSDPGPLDINRALDKRVWSSSIHAGGVPTRAVDGGYNPNWNEGTCMHTGNNNHAWFAVDLDGNYLLDRVTITQQNSNSKS